jgi:cell division septum initiation protein DivIVA
VRGPDSSLTLTHLTGDTMTEQSDLIPDLDSEDAFEVQMRGYSRRQVNEFVARSRSQTRDLEERLSRSIDEVERMRAEVSASRQRDMEDKPAHQELSERMAQILKLADDEAKAQKARALEEITQQRNEAKQEIDRLKAEAREQTERMLAAAQEQAENTIATARAEADKARTSASNEAERTVGDAQKKSENAVAAAQAQAKQMLDEATARATAIHDGAERRLNLLVARHTETVRRLTEVRDVVTNLVAGEAARGSLEEEVARSVASALSGNGGGNGAAAAARPGSGPEGRHAPGAAPAAGSRPADGPANGPADAAARSHRGSPVPSERAPGERPAAAPAGAAPSSGAPSGSSAPGGTAPGGTPPGSTPPGGTGPRSLPSERPAPAGSDRGREPAAKPVRPTAGRGTPGSLGDRADSATGDGGLMSE